MKSALITIGDEILIGQVADTNAVWISRELNTAGVRVSEMITVSDRADQIREVLDRYLGRMDIVIMTGGLGPTRDDITKQTLADYFGGRLIPNAEIEQKIIGFFQTRGRTVIESNLKQAEVPENCRVLMNNHGSAPGMWFEREGTIVISLPGVPYEMKGLMTDHVLPEIRRRVKVPQVVHRTIMTQGIPESYLAEIIRGWEDSLPECVKLAYLPRPGIVRLRLTVVGECAADASSMLESIEGKLLELIPEHIFGYDDITLEQSTGNLLREKGLTVATAESCTGGTIASMITSVPGSSAYFKGSVVAYSNQVKKEVLKVTESVIKENGAVSKQVVEQMARGVQGLLNSDTAISTSGIAGPDGGTEDKPLGTTWIGVAYGEKVVSRMFRFGGSRERIIAQASFSAMQMLRKLILGYI